MSMVTLTAEAGRASDPGLWMHGLTKYERIQLVRRLGLNTEVNVLIASEADWERNRAFLSGHSMYSVRTFRTPRWSGPEPHFAIMEVSELQAQYRHLLANGLSLIVAEPVDPADAELAGCLMVQADHFLAEVAFGPGTVRRVTHDGDIDRIVSISATNPSGDSRLDEAVREARQALRAIVHIPFYELQGLIFEFSWYRVPVGWQQKQLIFWEVAGSVAQEALLERFLGGRS